MSRLEFAPKLKEIQVTDIQKGIGVFAPKIDQLISFAGLQNALKHAGYKLADADITAQGTLEQDASGAWWLVVEPSNQRFALAGDKLKSELSDAKANDRVELTGDWKTVGAGAKVHEVIAPRALKKLSASSARAMKRRDARVLLDGAQGFNSFNYDSTGDEVYGGSFGEGALMLAPIRTTSPGLTVYKGGAVIPRFSFTHQHLGALNVDRQVLDLSISYTPSPRVQLEAEAALFTRTFFDNKISSDAGESLGNIILWGKYRFYRVLKRWGDRQAAARFGLELPTSKQHAPTQQQLSAPAYVRQQLSANNGGVAAHLDAAFSQAQGRFIFGSNVEGVLRTERAGFRTGHELRINTDLEYVLFPLRYRRPTKELFAILETNYIRRSRGRLDKTVVTESRASEYFIAPGLQYVATSQIVLEASVQLPLVRRTDAQALRTDRNILLAVHFLF